jgi:hypothetical protein
MSGDSNLDNDRVNMVPLIDCMFFIILFFMITMKFGQDVWVVSSLLPTDQGTGGPPPRPIALRERINVAIYPEGFAKGHQPSKYRQQAAAALESDPACFEKSALIRIGGSDPIRVDGFVLSLEPVDAPEMKDQVERMHAYVKKELAERDLDGRPRGQQPQIVISCFSGMPWKYALLAYDAVRAYEVDQGGGSTITDAGLREAREVCFAPPNVRNSGFNEQGQELYEIVHLR